MQKGGPGPTVMRRQGEKTKEGCATRLQVDPKTEKFDLGRRFENVAFDADLMEAAGQAKPADPAADNDHPHGLTSSAHSPIVAGSCWQRVLSRAPASRVI